MKTLVPIDDNRSIAVTVEEDFKEVYVGIYNQTLDCWEQDLVMVRPSTEELETADVFVWNNPNTDDWTGEFSVGIGKEDETCC